MLNRFHAGVLHEVIDPGLCATQTIWSSFKVLNVDSVRKVVHQNFVNAAFADDREYVFFV
jgi:hypothetical protein